MVKDTYFFRYAELSTSVCCGYESTLRATEPNPQQPAPQQKQGHHPWCYVADARSKSPLLLNLNITFAIKSTTLSLVLPLFKHPFAAHCGTFHYLSIRNLREAGPKRNEQDPARLRERHPCDPSSVFTGRLMVVFLIVGVKIVGSQHWKLEVLFSGWRLGVRCCQEVFWAMMFWLAGYKLGSLWTLPGLPILTCGFSTKFDHEVRNVDLGV